MKSRINKITIELILIILLANLAYALLNTPSFIGTSETDFNAGTLDKVNVTGSGADANVTLNFTINTGGMSGGHRMYNLSGNFTSQIFDSNTTDAVFDRIAWASLLPNSSNVLGYALDTGSNDIGAFYRNGSAGTDITQANLAGDIDFTEGLIAYSLPAGLSREDLVGFAWDDDASGNIFAFFRNGSVAVTGAVANLASDVLFTTTDSYTIPSGFNTSSIIGFAVNTGGTEAAVFFRNRSYAQAASEQPPFSFSSVLTFTIPSGFNMDDALSIAYDRGADDIALAFRNRSLVSDTAQTSFGTDIAFDSVIAATYNTGFNLTTTANITLQTRVSNDSTTFTAWSNAYVNPDGTENIGKNARYMQYKALFTTPDKYKTPYLLNVTINFTGDVTAPSINRIAFSPNATDNVDPDVLLNFTVNVTDNPNQTEVKTVVLQYKQSGAGTFTNATMEFNSATNLYNASFTPNIADTWNYRIYARDNASNNDTSDAQNISVQNDRTWKRNPAAFDNIACGFSKICTAGNLTINNTGDFTMNFDLSSNFGDTSYNVTEPFDLAAKEIKVIEVNLTAGSSAAESNVVITTDATTSNADPDSATTNFTLTSSAGGPVFEIAIINPPTEANRSSPTAFHLNASLRNIGNETAGNTWINWTLPANWLNISGTNLTKNISNLSVNEVVYHNITINLTSSASTGTQRVNATAASNDSASDSAAASIVVTETGTVTTVTETTTTGGGGSGGGGGGGGGGSLVKVIVKPEEIEISQIVDLVRGKDNTFTIGVTNTFENSVLEGLTLHVEGFLSQYLTVTPEAITGLGYGQTRAFTVAVAAPSYKGFEEHTLKAVVTGMVVKTEEIQNITATSRNPFTLRNYISLIIHEISKEEAGSSLGEAEKLIGGMQQAGFPANKASKLLEEAKEELSSRRYHLAKAITGEISNIRENAFSANALIYEIKQKIYAAENKGLQAEETRRLLNLAQAAFEREDFTAAIQRAKDAQLSIVIETKGRLNIAKLVMDYWWPLLVLLIALSISGYFVRKKLTLIIISRMLQDLQKEEAVINELMQETQEKYYKEKKISTTEYHKSMYGYEKRLSEVSQTISMLRSKRVGIIEISNEIRNLKKEDQNAVDLIKQLQDGYFNRQTITKKIYLKRAEEYKLRRIVIESSIAVLEAKLAKKEKLEELEAKEVSQNQITGLVKEKEREFKNYSQAIKPKPNVPKGFSGFSLKNLLKGKEKCRSEEVKGIIDDLIKRKDRPKPVILPRARISTIQREVLGIKSEVRKDRAEAPAAKHAWPIKAPVQEPKETISKLPKMETAGKKQEAHLTGKKEIISGLRDKIGLDIKVPKISKKPRQGYIKHFSEDGDALRKHGFKIKVPGEKEPEPKYALPKPISHTKHSILNHFREVYKHG